MDTEGEVQMYKDLTNAEVIADSIWDGVRLTTMRATFPRFILAEFNTHRMFSRNSASSRAIPSRRQASITHGAPYIPSALMYNQTGMQATELMTPEDEAECQSIIQEMLDSCAAGVDRLAKVGGRGLHKQWASRYIEPWAMHTVIVSSTEWDNFFLQRDHEDAQPEMQATAKAMRKALDESTPLQQGFHLPFYAEETWLVDLTNSQAFEQYAIRSVARCARVSYGRELEEKTYEEDVALVERLIRGRHASPFEHVSAVDVGEQRFTFTLPNGKTFHPHEGNFSWPWKQLRHNLAQYLPSIAARLE